MADVSGSKADANAVKAGLWNRFVDYFSPTLGPNVTAEDVRQYRTTIAFIPIGGVIIFGFGRLNAKLGNMVPAVVEQVGALVILSMLFAVRRGHVRPAAHVAIFASSLTIFFAMWY